MGTARLLRTFWPASNLIMVLHLFPAFHVRAPSAKVVRHEKCKSHHGQRTELNMDEILKAERRKTIRRKSVDELRALLEEADRPGRQAEQETRVLATTVQRLDLKAIREKLRAQARCMAAT